MSNEYVELFGSRPAETYPNTLGYAPYAGIPQGLGAVAGPTTAILAKPLLPPGQKGESVQTHEAFIHAVRTLAADRLDAIEPGQAKVKAAKLVYGRGDHNVRGVCYYGVWANGGKENAEFIEVSALGEENPCQLAGTTIHELGHVLAGHEEGHSKVWQAACGLLGLQDAKASAQEYKAGDFAADLWPAIEALGFPADGSPAFAAGHTPGLLLPKGPRRPVCKAGIGRKGGKSRGAGSGSRLRLYECKCVSDPGNGVTPKARVASDVWQALCGRCNAEFKLVPPKGKTIRPVLEPPTEPIAVDPPVVETPGPDYLTVDMRARLAAAMSKPDPAEWVGSLGAF